MAVSMRVLAVGVVLVVSVQASTHHSNSPSIHPSTRPWSHPWQEVIYPRAGGPRVLSPVLGMDHDSPLPRHPHIPPINGPSTAYVAPDDVPQPYSAAASPPTALTLEEEERDARLSYFVSACVPDSHASSVSVDVFTGSTDDLPNAPSSAFVSASSSAFFNASTNASNASTTPISASLTPSTNASSIAYLNGSSTSLTTSAISTSSGTSTTSNASTNASTISTTSTNAFMSSTRKWRLTMSPDGVLTLQEPEGLPWGVARPLGNLRKTWLRSATPKNPTISLRRDEVHRHKRQVEEEEGEGGFVSSVVKSFSANILWVKIVSDQILGAVFTLGSSVTYYVLHLIGLGHLLSTGEIIGILWALYDAKVAFVTWLVEHGYLV